MKDKQVLQLLHKSMKYLSDTFARSIRNNIDSSEDLYNDLVIVYYSRKDKPKSKEVNKKSEKDVSYYWYVTFKNYLLDKYRRSVRESKILKKLEGMNHERFLQSIFVKKDFII